MRNTESITCICVPDVNKQTGGSRDAEKQRILPDCWVNCPIV